MILWPKLSVFLHDIDKLFSLLEWIAFGPYTDDPLSLCYEAAHVTIAKHEPS